MDNLLYPTCLQSIAPAPSSTLTNTHYRAARSSAIPHTASNAGAEYFSGLEAFAELTESGVGMRLSLMSFNPRGSPINMDIPVAVLRVDDNKYFKLLHMTKGERCPFFFIIVVFFFLHLSGIRGISMQ